MKRKVFYMNLALFFIIFVLVSSTSFTPLEISRQRRLPYLWCGLLTGFAQEQETDSEIITLYVAQTQSIPVDIPTRIAIGNPEVADITAVDAEQITITAKGPGMTNLIWWDLFGEQAVKIRVYAEEMSEIKLRIDALLKSFNLPDVYTQAVDSEGKVLLLGEVKSEDDVGLINTVLEQLKEKTINLIQVKEEETSIEIDVQVLELNKDATKTLGFTWPGSLSLTESSGPVTTPVTGLSALFHVSDWTRSAFSSKLDFLIQEGKARILSRPRLACQSGKEAELLIGGEKPILTTIVSLSGQGTAVEYKEFGIKLKMKPKLINKSRIFLGLDIEVSDVGEAEILGKIDEPTAKAFPLIKRTTSTELYLNDGQTMAISGLIKQKTEEDLRKFPWLADIPVLGLFFRQKEVKIGGGTGERGDTELVITLTPTVIPKEKIQPPSTLSKEEGIPSRLPERIPEPPKIRPKISGPIIEYKKSLSQYILSNLIYPYEAKSAGLRGELILSLRLSSTGNLLEVNIKKSSGNSILDNNSIKMFRHLSPFPPFPKDIKEQDLWLDIPIAYNLK